MLCCGADDLPSANSIRRLGSQLSAFAGPSVGAALVALGGTSLAFALDAVSFLLSAGCIVAVARSAALQRRDERERSALHDLREGIATVMGSGWIWVTIGVAGISNITMSAPAEAVLPFLVRSHLHAGVAVYGLLRSLQAAGSVVVAICLGRRVRLRHRGPVMYCAWLLAAVRVGAAAVFVLGGAISAALIGLGLLHPSVRGLD